MHVMTHHLLWQIWGSSMLLNDKHQNNIIHRLIKLSFTFKSLHKDLFTCLFS